MEFPLWNWSSAAKPAAWALRRGCGFGPWGPGHLLPSQSVSAMGQQPQHRSLDPLIPLLAFRANTAASLAFPAHGSRWERALWLCWAPGAAEGEEAAKPGFQLVLDQQQGAGQRLQLLAQAQGWAPRRGCASASCAPWCLISITGTCSAPLTDPAGSCSITEALV